MDAFNMNKPQRENVIHGLMFHKAGFEIFRVKFFFTSSSFIWNGRHPVEPHVPAIIL
jgi:hypothetical protein